MNVAVDDDWKMLMSSLVRLKSKEYRLVKIGRSFGDLRSWHDRGILR